MQVDILFIDMACSKPYTWETLENDSLGGSESSTIRLAEGFASKGHSVAIVQRYPIDYQMSPNGVQYCGPSWSYAFKPKNVIFVRANGRWDRFPDAIKILWIHDASSEEHNNLSLWTPGLHEQKVLTVAVSDWHVSNVQQYAPGIAIKRIYSPLDETCYQPSSEYDKNQLVWLASPHKGLNDGLQVFNEILGIQPQMKLAVFNPGYYSEHSESYRSVVFLPKQKRQVLRNVVSKSLCMFYPTSFEETFGLIAAESNALGTPVATYPIAALAESAIDHGIRTKQDLIDKILEWRNSERPVVTGQQRFRFSEIYPEWCKVLNL